LSSNLAGITTSDCGGITNEKSACTEHLRVSSSVSASTKSVKGKRFSLTM